MAYHKALKDAGLHPPSSSDLFKDFHNLQGVWTHPLMLDMKKNHQKAESESESDDEDDESESEGDPMDDECNSSDNEENLPQPGPSQC